MIIRHDLPGSNFVKFDNNIFLNQNLTDGAKVLYGYLCGLRNGAGYTDKIIVDSMKISKTILTRRKKELKNEGLLLVDQISPRVFVAYIGHSRKTAMAVKDTWIKDDRSVL